MMIEIKKEAENKLSIKIWRINIYDKINELHMCLDNYFEESRPTKRHRYRTGRYWLRTGARNNNLTNEEVMALLPQDIVKEIKDKAKKHIDDLMIGILY